MHFFQVGGWGSSQELIFELLGLLKAFATKLRLYCLKTT